MAAFRPIRYRTFVAREEPQRGSDAMNTRPIEQKIPQVQAQLFLSWATDRNDNVMRVTFLNLKQQRVCMLLCLAIRNIAILWIDRETAPAQPGYRLLFGSLRRNDPEQFFVFSVFALDEQALQVGDSRNFPQAPSTRQSPKKYQQPAVG